MNDLTLSATKVLECLTEGRTALFSADQYMADAYNSRHALYLKQFITRSQKFLAGDLEDLPPAQRDPESARLPFSDTYIEATWQGLTPSARDRLCLLCTSHPTAIWSTIPGAEAEEYRFSVRALAYCVTPPGDINPGMFDRPRVVDPLSLGIVSYKPGAEGVMVRLFKLTEGRESAEDEKDTQAVILGAINKVLDFLAIINCANIGIKEIEAPARLNKARRAKGRIPFFNFKTLYIKTARADYARPDSDADRHRAGPCLHWRRGHIRRLASGVRIWIGAALIGSAARGLVVKDYKL